VNLKLRKFLKILDFFLVVNFFIAISHPTTTFSQTNIDFIKFPKNQLIYIKPEFENIVPVSSADLAYPREFDKKDERAFLIMKNNKWGIFSKNQRLILKPQFDKIEALTDTLYAYLVENKWGVVNIASGKFSQPVFEGVYSFFYSENYFKVKQNGKFGLLRQDCKLELQPVYDQIYEVGSTNVYLVAKENKSYLVSVEQNKAIEASYDKIEQPIGFEDKSYGCTVVGALNYLKLKKDNKYGVLSTDFSIFIEPKYEDIKIEENKIVEIKQNGKWGIADQNDNVLVVPKFDDIFSIDGKTFIVSLARKYGIIDLTGKFTAQPVYDELAPFNSSGVLVAKKDGKYFLINKDGIPICNFLFDKIERDYYSSDDYYYRIYSGKKVGFISKDTKVILPQSMTISVQTFQVITGKMLS